MQTSRVMSTGAIPLPAYNMGLTARSTSFMDIASFPMIYTCSPMPHQHLHQRHHQQQNNTISNKNNNNNNNMPQPHHHHHHHHLLHQRHQQHQNNMNNKNIGNVRHHQQHPQGPYGSHYCSVTAAAAAAGNLSVSCSSSGNSSNSATDDTSSVGSRSPDLPTPTMSPCTPTTTAAMMVPPPSSSSSSSGLMQYGRRCTTTEYTSLMSANNGLTNSSISFGVVGADGDGADHNGHRVVSSSSTVPSYAAIRPPIRPFTIEAILGLRDSRRPAPPSASAELAASGVSATPLCSLDLSLDVLVANSQAEQRGTNGGGVMDSRNNHAVGSKRKQGGKRKSSPSEKEFRVSAYDRDDDDGDKPSSNSSKCKRVRTIFTHEQLEKLENEFERQQYMVGPERLYLAASLNLTEAQVKVWFQNRRIKFRKQHLEMQQAKLAKIRSDDDQDNDDDVIDANNAASGEQLLGEDDEDDDEVDDEDDDDDEDRYRQVEEDVVM